MMKKIILFILLGFSFCKTLNDAQENDDRKKCKNSLLYNVFLSQELTSGTSGQIQNLPILFSYSECIETAKLKRGKIEIPL